MQILDWVLAVNHSVTAFHCQATGSLLPQEKRWAEEEHWHIYFVKHLKLQIMVLW